MPPRPVPPEQTTQPATTSALPDDSVLPAPDRFKRFDDLSLKGWAISYPKVADTILADHLGVRDALADIGIGISPINTANFQYDFLQNDRGYRGPQLYNGQRIHEPIPRPASPRPMISAVLASRVDRSRRH
ncbi:hypothetical protein ASE69_20940 [Sphingomonas sp. Leaf208]|nr:hypothetical protein ASE69_20940 [Sphingomonas sp. Leaf208]